MHPSSREVLKTLWGLTGFAWLAYFVVGGGTTNAMVVAAMVTFFAVYFSILLLAFHCIGF